MSDRKYRQRGYQDSEKKERSAPQAPKASLPRPPADRIETRLDKAERKAMDGRGASMPGFREVVRCARCGTMTAGAINLLSSCSKCGADLHSCAQCESFDTASRFECTQKLPVRVSPKDARNTCELFSARVTVERETHSQPSTSPTQAPNSAKKAFDDLFK
jgi:hypothetical protein